MFAQLMPMWANAHMMVPLGLGTHWTLPHFAKQHTCLPFVACKQAMSGGQVVAAQNTISMAILDQGGSRPTTWPKVGVLPTPWFWWILIAKMGEIDGTNPHFVPNTPASEHTPNCGHGFFRD